MKINRESWHYRLYRCFWAERTESFCTYFWKIVLGTILFPMLFPILILMWSIGWFIGFWPNFGRYEEKKGDPRSPMFHPRYKFDGHHQHRFAPWEIVLPLAAVGGVVYWAITDWTGLFTVAIFVGITITVIVFLAGLIFLICRGWRTETFKIVRAFVAAKKKKVCPLIVFEG